MKLIFFSDSHLAPKFSKWSPIQKKLVVIFKGKQPFFYAVSILIQHSKIKLGKSIWCVSKWTLGWIIYNVQAHLNPGWCLVIDQDACLVIDQDACAAFWKQT